MFDKFFEKYPDYITSEKPDQNLRSTFIGRLPAQLIDFWDTYGFGVFMDGYLKIVNPEKFQGCFDVAYNNTGNEIVFGVTALGDFLTWTGDAIRAVYFKNGYDTIIEIGDDMEWFFDMDLADSGFLKDNLNNAQYLKAKAILGIPDYNECFGYFPLLGLGGSEKVENLQRVIIPDHIFLIANALGKME